MLSFLPGWLLLPFSFSGFALNLACWGLVVTPLGIIKLLLPFKTVHRLTGYAGKGCYRGWTAVNTALINLFNQVDWQVTGAQTLDKQSWYLLISNHKSWLDIPVVSTVAHSRIPEPKFFLKDELKWLPFLGTGCWALDMPFMKRYSPAQLAKVRPSSDAPWVAQRFVPGQEYCSFSVLVDGQLRAHSSYQPRYRVGRGSGIYFHSCAPAPIRAFLEQFGRATGYTGQVGFDFIEDQQGRFHVLECNPRATSGVHLFDDQRVQLVERVHDALRGR